MCYRTGRAVSGFWCHVSGFRLSCFWFVASFWYQGTGILSVYFWQRGYRISFLTETSALILVKMVNVPDHEAG